ncbi:hypothetical protein jhhlp_002891 [Lomentospora prolificans]|uniref:Uncharacterized protein n=1 Tax=Lomentospora prolificans TaxID=41688 RepID=A0A2N3NFA9_9PEZI|nr:hypothetical protein jhhlp_002891 [Lomentospora prolificans]
MADNTSNPPATGRTRTEPIVAYSGLSKHPWSYLWKLKNYRLLGSKRRVTKSRSRYNTHIHCDAGHNNTRHHYLLLYHDNKLFKAPIGDNPQVLSVALGGGSNTRALGDPRRGHRDRYMDNRLFRQVPGDSSYRHRYFPDPAPAGSIQTASSTWTTPNSTGRGLKIASTTSTCVICTAVRQLVLLFYIGSIAILSRAVGSRQEFDIRTHTAVPEIVSDIRPLSTAGTEHS